MIHPSYYSSENGSLYKVAQERNWNSWTFDVAKRLERAKKKGNFSEDIEKTITVIELCKSEFKPSFFYKFRMLFINSPNLLAARRGWDLYTKNIVFYMEIGMYDKAIEECSNYFHNSYGEGSNC